MRRPPADIVTDQNRFVKVGLSFEPDCCILYKVGCQEINAKNGRVIMAVSLLPHNVESKGYLQCYFVRFWPRFNCLPGLRNC